MRPFYSLKVITPQGLGYAGDAVHTLIPAEDGFVGVLAHHASYVTSSAGGNLEVLEKDGSTKRFRVGPGFFEIAKDQAVFLTQSFSAL